MKEDEGEDGGGSGSSDDAWGDFAEGHDNVEEDSDSLADGSPSSQVSVPTEPESDAPALGAAPKTAAVEVPLDEDPFAAIAGATPDAAVSPLRRGPAAGSAPSSDEAGIEDEFGDFSQPGNDLESRDASESVTKETATTSNSGESAFGEASGGGNDESSFATPEMQSIMNGNPALS